MRNWLFIIIIALALGCSKHPLGQDYIYTQKDDLLTLQQKVDILKNAGAVQDDAMLASISLLYAQNNNWVEAKDAISKAIKRNPINATYHLYLANYNAELANNVEAYQEAKMAFELGTYDKKLEELLARMAIETADPINSDVFVTKYFKSNRNKMEAQILMAKLHFFNKNYIEAINMTKKILIADSTNIEALKIAYKSYVKLNRVEFAINYGEKLVEIDSTNALYYFELANYYLGDYKNAKAAAYFVKSYRYHPLLSSLYLGLKNYANLFLYDSVLLYSDSAFAGINYTNKYVLLARAQAFDKKYKFDESYVVYKRLIEMDSTDSLVNAEQAIVLRKIAYLHRKKREQKQLADSVAGSMPIIKF